MPHFKKLWNSKLCAGLVNVYVYISEHYVNKLEALSFFFLFQGVTYALLTKFICVYVY